MLHFASDENLNGDIGRGLRLHRPGLDLIRVQEAGFRGEDDPTVLAWAAEEGRIPLTHDRATLPGFAHARVVRGRRCPASSS